METTLVEPQWTETDRLNSLYDYDILDSPKEKEFEGIVRMAAQACNVPISLISFVAPGRQWFKAAVGIELTETPLDISICSQAILQKDIFVVPDTTQDERTKDNPLVTGEPHLRFYAGALLQTPEGLPLGTVCVLDYKPRTLSEQESDTLRALARMVMTQLELRRTATRLRRALEAKSKSEERANFLAQLTEKLSMLSSPYDLNRIATREVGQFLRGARCYFFEAVPPYLHCQVSHDWCIESEKSLEGTYDLAVFGEPEMWRTLDSQSAMLCDTSTHPWTVPWLENYQAMNIAAALIAPFCRDGKWVCCLGVSSQTARQWTHEERTLLEDVMARVWPLIERARIEQALRESEERFRAMSDNIAPLAWMAKADGMLFWYNKRWYDFTGTTFETMEGDGWKKCHHPDHLPNVVASWQEALKEGHPWEHTFPLRGANGEYRWFLSRASPIRDDDGKIIRWFGANTDVTELRLAHEELTQAKADLAFQNQTLEETVRSRTAELQDSITELEAFSYSISHDMRSPLRAMHGYAEMLMTDYRHKLDETGVRYLARIGRGAMRLDLLIRDVLNYSTVAKGEITLGPINIERLVRDVIQNYPDLEPVKIRIVVEPLPTVIGHEVLLTQIISNLLGNAMKFSRPGVFPEVRVYAETTETGVRICFADNGIGIAENHLKVIFQIFGRINPDNKYQGTGIGLAIVRKAAERMGGCVGVTSELGRGSTFRVNLKAA